MDLRFDFSGDDDSKLGGFRLSFFEAYNWGTYNNCIVKLDLNSNNALLTGDIGSGKSTLVDALTTLIVPHQKIIYNKAAGANTKERTLSSYILGEYKSSQDEKFGNSKAVALRDNSNYSVLLARFKNKGFEEILTIAQFFYIHNNQVNKFFIVSQGELSIKKDFLKVETIKGLKKQLRDTPHTKVFDIFKDYSKEFRRVMGIKNDQALNLFYQTVSLKSIGNLTEFIRLHMLESNDIDNHIDKLCISFADLNHTHELIKKAKHQIELLEPINKDSKKYKKLETTIENLNNISDGLNIYFSKYQKELFETKIKELSIELIKNNSSKEELNEEIKTLNEQITNQRIELKSNGGDRINQIENEIKNYTSLLQKAKKENESFNKIIKTLGYSAISNEHSFLHTRDKIDNEYSLIDENITKLENEIMLDNNSIQNYKSEKKEIDIEIIYLKNHPSNIPHKVSKIRDDMANSLGIKRESLPFVGELIKICDEQWCGAIERVLHNFALSLIVDISLYDEVSSYIENTNLKGKLVYLKVNPKQKSDDFVNNIPNSLLEKLELKIDSPYYKWLNNNLNEKFNISCVDNMLDFRRFKKALTINGQYKSNLFRHEKDDRFDINDSSRWILGWNNLIKLEQFKLNLKSLEEKIEYLDNKIDKNNRLKKQILEKRDNLRDILKYDSFEFINWYKYSKLIDELKIEKKELEESTNIIQSLQDSITLYENKQIDKKVELENLTKNIGRLEQLIEDRKEELEEANLVLNNNILNSDIKISIDNLKNELCNYKFNLNNIKHSKRVVKEKIDKDYKNNLKKQNNLVIKIQKDMSEYIRDYQVESKDFDASIESIDEFTTKLQKLKKDNLPKWEIKFNNLLKENTIQGILILHSTLEEYSKDIENKIKNINLSLKDIEYSDGTYIELLAIKSNISEIKEFKQKLKSVISGSINEDNSYDEHKFLEIKELINRFNGREGYIDFDKKWRKTVLDVRNWFDFSASEKYMSDNSQKEYYAHSGGKSGGQKEKLAYTVLASSLAYQFGLEYDKVQSRSFRFVMIDEAFGRGSDESTKYALKLFEKLKLQLLVITPKQKINVIESYVQSVHFVHNQDGMDSSLISMKIEEYQRKKTE